MAILAPIMLFGWVPFTIYLFFRLPPHRAVLVSMIGGWLLLPMTGYNIPGIPTYDKSTAISLGLILGGWLSGQRFKADFSWKIYDLPMLIWCLSPIFSSLANQLGLYNGLSGTYGQIMLWGVPYFAGRIYLHSDEALKDFCLGILIGGMVYALLCLYEIKMSPRLSINIYDFFPHEWRQHKRFGGWRPIVFMQHGLMVAVWMAVTATTAFWLWRSRLVEQIKGIPIGIVTVVLIITALLCKAASGWVALILGCCGYYVYRRHQGNLLFVVLLITIPSYMVLRSYGIVEMDDVLMIAAPIFDEVRTGSLAIRLHQEDLFIARALERPLLGWGGYSRGWPVDPNTGEKLIGMVDALWIIVFSSKGFLGISSFVAGMLIGPWVILRATGKGLSKDNPETRQLAVMLSLIVLIFMVDTLVNGMVNPIYTMITGALVGWYIKKLVKVQKRERLCGEER